MAAVNQVPVLAAIVYATACCVLGLSFAISTSIHANPDDYYDNNNFTIYSYHLPDDEGSAISNSSFPDDWFFSGFTDSPPDGDLHYNAYDVIEAGIKDSNNGKVDFVPIEAGVKRNPTRVENQADKESDVVENFLQWVEDYGKNKATCQPGTQYNLGNGVIKQYGLKRFQAQAMIAVNRANFLTRLWRNADSEYLQSEYLFYAQVRNIVEADPDIFAAGNCYDKDEFKDYHLFCPFSHRTEDGRITIKDLSLEYPYLGNDSDFFYSARIRASKLENFNFTKGEYLCRIHLCLCIKVFPNQVRSHVRPEYKCGLDRKFTLVTNLPLSSSLPTLSRGFRKS
ncbi:G-protein-coupled receptor 158 [Elysia marginata]|uniref:G-protein-coupled receptor 158 n=1 Tax=Elysia marginata TaxID=1093978 RepID=A0AAV4J170_9GAST|nr:G-protein-coupled receptor 158 [Elysia marginata]